MRLENQKMQSFLTANGIEARVKYIDKGGLRGNWRLYNPHIKNIGDNSEIITSLSILGFKWIDGTTLTKFCFNGGLFHVFCHHPNTKSFLK